jgi:glycosyltransferase involved in cell wall biosynthesis
MMLITIKPISHYEYDFCKRAIFNLISYVSFCSIMNIRQSSNDTSTWLKQAQMVINIPNLYTYEDTLSVVGILSNSLACCYVLTTEGQALTPSQKLSWPRLEIINLPNPSFPKHASQTVKRLAKGGGVDIIHDLFGHLSSFCEIKHKPDRPFIMIHTQRTTNWGWFSRVRPLRYQIDLRYAGQRAKSLWHDTRILHAVDHITVMGPGHELDLIEGHGIDADKISFIPSETDCDRFTSTGSTDKENFLLYTGALVRAKGLDLLFDAFNILGRSDPQLKLMLIGRETTFEKRWFRQRVNHHPLKDRIEVLDFMPREQLIQYYRRAKLYVFPSLFEGSPRSLREAIACGTSTIASDIPGHRGIDPKGQFIRFVPVGDLETWVRLSKEALEESVANYQERTLIGINRLLEHHHPTRVADQWAQLYQKIATQNNLTS